jgi:Contractile injection system tube protein/LysM domain
MSTSSLVKAVIMNVDHGDRVECLFNPKEYTVAKQNTWEKKKVTGANMPQVTFSGGQPTTLQMELFFDTYAMASDGHAKDVRKEYTDKIWNLMMVDERLKDKKNKKGRPPTVRFQWGDAWSFHAIISSIQQKFTLFLSTGTPVRATLTVAFEQVQDDNQHPAQNPTSGGIGGERFWTVVEGDTLQWIAYKEYGDATRWRPIADANNLGAIRHLQPGTTLIVPNG